MPEPPLLECQKITKRFGGAAALDGVDFSLVAGEAHGLVGANGAGKSTLMKILAGAIGDYEGQTRIDGQAVRLDTPQRSLAAGISMVYQELSGVGQLSVAENLFLGRQPITRLGRVDWRAMRRAAQEYLAELQIEVDVRRRLDSYPLAIRQLVEIARGLHSGSRVLILDEPTSALSPPETRRLFELVGRARQRGVAIVLISHFIEDVLEVCDRVTLLRDGQRVFTRAAAELSKAEVIHAMLGHQISADEPGYLGRVRLPPATSAAPGLVCEGLTLEGAFRDVTLSVAPGETLGIYGFVGAGHSELVRALAGGLAPTGGTVRVDGAALAASPRAAIGRGVVFVGADRAQSLVHASPLYKNVTLAHLSRALGPWLRRGPEMAVAEPRLAQVGCRPLDARLAAGALSGGNQQKVVIAKWLLGPARYWLLEEPTRGMDVGAKQEVLALVAQLKQQGAGVILASSEPELVLEHSDRIVVMSRGRVAREFANCEVDKSALVHHA
ncbi:MAG: sugar ABC transporter ATP-binding protein [Pirellulales bacterium]|nr:sugar ABC transporter ATP-binding protein [Pirellulales bacterium]